MGGVNDYSSSVLNLASGLPVLQKPLASGGIQLVCSGVFW